MNILVYTVAAVVTLALPLRTWLQLRQDPLRRDFLALGANLCLCYLCFALHLATGLAVVRMLSTTAVSFIPLTLYQFLSSYFVAHSAGVERLSKGAAPVHPGPDEDRRVLSVLQVLTPLVAALFLAGEFTVFSDTPRASLGAVLLSLYVLLGVGWSLRRILRVLLGSTDPVEKTRLGYLLGLATGAALFTALETLARAWIALPLVGASGTLAQSTILQGAIPPIGVVFTSLLFFVLHQILVLSRLLDLHEIFARVLTIALCGLPLVLMEGVHTWIAGGPVLHPLHGTFLVFLTTTLFLSLYDPLRTWVERIIVDRFNRRGRMLELSLEEVERNVATAIREDDLCSGVLTPLVSSGRVPFASIYLWDSTARTFRRAAWIGAARLPPPSAVPPEALQDLPRPSPPARPAGWVRGDLARSPSHRAALDLLDTLTLDVLLPLHGEGDTREPSGFLGLRHEPWSDGFSKEELARLRRVGDRVGVALENLRGHQRMEEQHRLAALGTMAAGLAHEIRNPLAGIRGAAQLLQTTEIPEESQEFLQIIVEEGDRLNRIVDQFLDYARPYEVAPARFEMGALLAQVVHLVRCQDLPDRVQVQLEVDPRIPTLLGDPTRLSQVFLNLVQNAIQAMPAGGTVSLRAHLTQPPQDATQGPIVEVQVQDTGVGIPPGDIPNLFIPFFTTRPGGTGLGLPISRRIVRAHQGDMAVQSHPGSGSLFIVRLPVLGKEGSGPP